MDRLTLARTEEILRDIRGVRALVIGDLMLDRYITGSVDRISPEAPVPVVRVEQESSAVGGAANVAANVAALGAACHLVGVVGRDGSGAILRDRLETLGVLTDGLVVSDDRPTSVKTRILARRQQVVRFDREVEADADARLTAALVERIEALGAECDVLVMEDYNKGVLVPDVIAAVLDAGRRRGAPTVVDPKRRNFFAFEGATVFKPNAKELSDALGEFLHPDDPAWMAATRRRLSCDNLLLTLGERGMALQTPQDEYVRIPAVARSVYDVSGAGDTVTAMMALALAAQASPAEAAILANHAAAIEVGKTGVATVSPEELLDHARTFYAGLERGRRNARGAEATAEASPKQEQESVP